MRATAIIVSILDVVVGPNLRKKDLSCDHQSSIYSTLNFWTLSVAAWLLYHNLYDKESSVVYTDFLKQQGIDTVEITGIQYFVVYQPEQLVVIGSSKIN